MSMDDDMNFFAAPPPPPPAVQPSSSADDFGFAPTSIGGDDEAPILLGGGGSGDADGMGMNPPPAYLGDVNEAANAGSFDDGTTPIVLVPPPPEDGAAVGDEPVMVEPEDDDDNNNAALVTTSEPSAMQKWNAEWQETLLVRKEEENARRAELVEAARVALEQFQAEREQRRESKMAKNREDEQSKLEAIEADLENDNSWQKVCKMVELSHDSTKQAQDVKRMRDLLILLKNDTAKATALGA
jgi:hypothetical protein